MTITLNDILVFGGAAAVLVLLFMLLGGGGERAQMQKRVQRMKARKNAPAKAAAGAADALSLRRKKEEAVSPFLELLMKPLPSFTKLGVRLTRAGIALNPKQYALRCLLALLVVTFAFKLLGKPLLLGFFIGIILSVWLPLKVVGFRINKQQKAFLQVFPDAIDLIVRGLRSGLPVSESITLVSKEVPEPVAGTFMHVANTMKLGVPMEKALQDVARKLDYTEFNFFVTSIVLQRETGGNLSEILNNLSEVLRKRFLMKMKIKAMTSEARASAMIIGSLPFFVGGAVFVMSRDYISVLFTDYRGNIALGIAATLLALGVGTMQRMAKFEI